MRRWTLQIGAVLLLTFAAGGCNEQCTAPRLTQESFGSLTSGWLAADPHCGTIGSVVVGAGGVIGRDSGYSGDIWREEVSGTTADLNGVWGSGESDIYAVGAQGTIVHQSMGTLDQYCELDDANWQAEPSPTTQTLYAVAGWGSTDVYAVGAGGTVLHSTGDGTWTMMSVPTSADLFAVWDDGTDVWAVGAGGVILRKPSTGGWTTVASGTNANLRSVWGSSSADVYAVGDGGTVLHGDGSEFSAVGDADVTAQMNLVSVSGDPTEGDVVVAGKMAGDPSSCVVQCMTADGSACESPGISAVGTCAGLSWMGVEGFDPSKGQIVYDWVDAAGWFDGTTGKTVTIDVPSNEACEM
jgi:hypothetical protein